MKLKNFDFRIYKEGQGYLEGTSSLSIEKNYKNVITITKSDFNDYFRDTCGYTYRNAEIELWTGFVDKNNQRIYEGDILQRDGRKYLVRYVEEESGFEIVELSNGEFTFFVSEICDELEIIGNVHENADLLPKV